MRVTTWLQNNTADLSGKWVAITGATGGIGEELCRYLARCGASLILLNRSAERSRRLEQQLKVVTPELSVTHVLVDLEDMTSVRRAAEQLCTLPVDVFIHNAGAYSIPRRITDTGYDNVFQINFLSPYYLIRTLLPTLRQRNGRAVVVGSIAHNYGRTDPADVDRSACTAASKVYGNAKRWLMFALYELFQGERAASLAVTHPGITFTNITAHYPKLIFALIKYPMKVLFMKPKVACLSILQGVFDSTPYHTWIGPRLFGIWGLPKKERLHTCTQQESKQIGKTAQHLWEELRQNEQTTVK